MGKKKTPEDKAKRARENGSNDDQDDIDDSLVLKEILPYTTGVYNELNFHPILISLAHRSKPLESVSL